MATALIEMNGNIIAGAFLITKMGECITRMKREIKKLKMQPVDNISKN